nr:MAG TPA: hypothetical protein [Caudoviricetes sp.]
MRKNTDRFFNSTTYAVSSSTQWNWNIKWTIKRGEYWSDSMNPEIK